MRAAPEPLDAHPLSKGPHPMDTLSPPVPPRCQGCTERIVSLEKRIADMERAFALMADYRSRPPARPSARQKAAERWDIEAG